MNNQKASKVYYTVLNIYHTHSRSENSERSEGSERTGE
jgi:hypothetical protein